MCTSFKSLTCYTCLSQHYALIWGYILGIYVLMLCSPPNYTNAATVMSVDLGNEWMKIGIISPGVPMEIALNRESKRKTPAILAFRDGIRSIGEEAVNVGIREPSSAYGYLLDLLGKTIDNPIVQLYRKRFPYYEIVGHPVHNTVIFKKTNAEEFTVEELVAQILVKAKEFGEASTLQTISECVLIVPGFFAQAEREAFINAAKLAKLNVLQLINDYTAVALNYAVFHQAQINETAQYYIFYDMGAYKTSAALVSYQMIKDKQTKEINPVVQVLGVGFDRTLGGLEIQMRLRDYLAAEFNAMKKTVNDVNKNPRSLAKLFKEAGRVKNVLSANNEHFAQIENLLDDQDFKILVTRDKLEELCSDLWPRVINPLNDALTSAGLSLNTISQVILFGGGTRVPKVQEIIKNKITQDLGKNLNADEAATMGAVYKAADLATGFKVKKIVIKDTVIFPIQIGFARDSFDSSDVKQVKRQLFGEMNSYPQKKIITFNKHTDDFKFNVFYGDTNNFSQKEIRANDGGKIMQVKLINVKNTLEKNQNDIIDSKGIKAYFALDDSGIFRCTGAEFVFEKRKQEDVESTLAKLGSTISKLFAKDETKENENSKSDNQENNKLSDDITESEKVKMGEFDNKNTAEKNEKKNPNSTNAFTNITVKEPIDYEILYQYPRSESESFEASFKKLNAINSAEEKRNQLESAFNKLESFVIEIKQKLNEEEYSSCATSEEKKNIVDESLAISEWLYEEIDNPNPSIYENRFNNLKKLADVVLARHWEHEERPDALKALDTMLEEAKKFLENAKNITGEKNLYKDVFTQVEIETLFNMIYNTVEWRDFERAAQNKLKRNDDVRLTVIAITQKMSELDREVKYLVNKLKVWKPKKKKEFKNENIDQPDTEYSKFNSSSWSSNSTNSQLDIEDESNAEKADFENEFSTSQLKENNKHSSSDKNEEEVTHSEL